jgi:hypothetical protein
MNECFMVTRYRRTRFWAVWDGDRLVAVVFYRKDAEEIRRRLVG